MLSVESIYIHIPFCKTKCPYCDFASWANKEDLIEKYFNALIYEIRMKCEAYINYRARSSESSCQRQALPSLGTQPLALCSIKTIFIGGGTPSLVHPDYYFQLFEEIRKYFNIDKKCEITLEANPGTIVEKHLMSYKNLGINRVSIGAQSFNEDILKTLGRKHSVEDTEYAINAVKSVGILNFNLDLIFSVPTLTKEHWVETIHTALRHEPKHISAYSLIIEPNTPFETIYNNPKLLPGEDFSFELYHTLCETLKEYGFNHYEISNFAKNGYESVHNLTYWHGKEYFGFGNSAHKYINGLRTCNLRNIEDYIQNPLQEIITEYPIDYDFEKIMLSSRLNNGFEINLIKKTSKKSTTHLYYLINEMSKEGLLKFSNEKVYLTEKGMFLNNEILLKLL